MSLTIAMLAGLRSLTTIGGRHPDSSMFRQTMRQTIRQTTRRNMAQNMATDASELPEKDSNPHLGDQNPSS